MVLYYVLEIFNFTCPTNRKSILVWKKQKKVSEYGLNQINKMVLLSVPKLIIIWEGTPTPDDVTRVFPLCHQWRNPQNNKIKYQSKLIHVYKQCRQKWHKFDTFMSGHCIFKPKIKQL